MSRRRDDAGFTLAEMTVVIGLLVTLAIIIGSALVTAFRSTARITDSTDTARQLQLAAERMARELRVADPIIAGAPRARSIQVRVFRGSHCDRLTYQVQTVGSSLQLIQYTQANLTPSPPASGVAPSTACTTPAAVLPTQPPTTTLPRMVLARDLDPAVAKVFTYYDASGAELDFDANPGLAVADIREIRITLRRPKVGRKSAVQVVTLVQVRNSLKVAP